MGTVFIFIIPVNSSKIGLLSSLILLHLITSWPVMASLFFVFNGNTASFPEILIPINLNEVTEFALALDK